MNPIGKCLLCLGAGSILFTPFGCASGGSYRGTTISSKARLQKAIREAEERHRHLKPALAWIVKGDYGKARECYEKLEADGVGRFGKERVRCLLSEGKVDEGLRVLSTLGPSDIRTIDSKHLRVAFAIKELRQAEKTAALPKVDPVPPLYRKSKQSNALDPSGFTADGLMTVAVAFGRKYDREMMDLVGSEALRRGDVNPDLLAEYAMVTQSNGDLCMAKSLYAKILTKKTSAKLRDHVSGRLYNITNYIGMVEREHPVKVEEKRIREKLRSTFFLESWN